MSAAKPLTNLQLQLLKSFYFNIPSEQLEEIKTLLANYFATKATEEMDKIWVENNWSQKTMDIWVNEHLRLEK